MKENKIDIFAELSGAVVNLDEDKAIRLCKEGLAKGIDANKLISRGLAKGMEIAGDRFEKSIYFIPELLLASDAMYAGLGIIKPALKRRNAPASNNAAIVIGVIEGDVHDIGKNIVKIMLEAAGYRMIDLGSDVPIQRFLDTAVKENAQMICLSSLVSTTMLRLGEVINLLTREGLRDRFTVMVGGACVSPSYARYIGADGYAPNAAAAVRKTRLLFKKKALNPKMPVATGGK